MTDIISVEIAFGELIDKITILEIKLERIRNAEKLANVQIEWQTLIKARDQAINASDELTRLINGLKAVN